MDGTVLYPLNELKEKYPDLFSSRQEHHEHQPKVLEDSIPRLGCFWDDVLHFTALHPTKIAEALKKLGYESKLKYYEVDAKQLSPERTMVFLNKPRELGASTKFTDFIRFDQNEVEKLAYIPEDAMEYAKKSIPTADEFLLNYRAPYILYKGEFDVSGAKIIEV